MKRKTKKSSRKVAKATRRAKRAYDVAKTYPTSEWISANKNSANAELKAAIAPGREKARALSQNAPYGVKAVDVIVAETIGDGIKANITGKNKTQTKKINELWKKWAETTACDFEGRHNFYGLQEIAMRSIVEAGEGLGLKKFSKSGPSIRLLEPDFIATDKDTLPLVQGIELDSAGRRVNYHIYKTHPGDKLAKLETIVVPAEEVVHVFKQKRAGQVRGITWAHAVVEKLKDHDDYQYSTLVRQKVAANFGGLITSSAAGSDALIDEEELKAKRNAEFQLEPATFKYLAPGEDLKLVSPPGVDGYSDFNRETLRAIAAGWGISYEALTGDYSQSNYSSSRLGHLQMRKNIESWRWNMFIPQFCDPTFQWFLEWAKMQGMDVDGVSVEWVPPAYSMIDPTKEIEALKSEVRAGFKSYKRAILEMGGDPETTLDEIAEWNQKFDEKKVSLEVDPRRLSQVGFAQTTDPLNLPNQTKDTNGQNQTDASSKPDPSGDQ